MSDRIVRVRLVGDAGSLVAESKRGASALTEVGRAGSKVGNDVRPGFSAATAEVNRFGSTTTGVMSKVSNVASAAGIATGIGAVALAFKGAVTQGLAFEGSLNTMGAVTGSTAAQMSKVSETARQLGRDVQLPATSAVDASNAMLELAKGGLSVDKSMTAAKGTLQLAAAASIEAGEAATIQSRALNMFGLEASQAGKVADVLANTANAATGEITDFALGMSQSGAVAHSFGVDIDDASTMLGIFANAGLAGSDGGTSFKSMLMSLASPTKQQSAALKELGVNVYDASGQFVGARELTDQLAQAKGRMSLADFQAAASTAFGSDAMRAATIAADAGVTAYDAMNQKINEQGGAADVAAAKMQGLGGVFGQVSNAASDAALSGFALLEPPLTAVGGALVVVFDAGSKALGFLTELPGPVWAGVAAFTAFKLLGSPVSSALNKIKDGYETAALKAMYAKDSIAGATGVMGKAGTAAKGAGSALMGAFGGPWGLAITAGATALSILPGLLGDTERAAQSAASGVDGLVESLRASNGVIDESVRNQALAALKAQEWGRESSNLADYSDRLGVSLTTQVDGLVGVAGASEQMEAAYRRTRAELEATIAAETQYDMNGQQILTERSVRAQEELRILDEQHVAYGELVAQSANMVSQYREEDAAARGKEAAQSGVTAGMEAQGRGLQAMWEAQQKVNTETGTATGLFHAFRDGLYESDGAAQAFRENMALLAEEHRDLPEPIGLAEAAMQGFAKETQAADTAGTYLYTTLERLAGGQVTAEAATRANEAAMRGIAGAARDLAEANQTVADKETALTELRASGTATAAELAAAQRDVDAAVDGVADAADRLFESETKAAQSAADMAGAAYAAKAAQGDYKGGVEAAVLVMQGQREEFILGQIEAGKSREEAEKLATAQGLIPENVRTQYEALNADAAKADADELKAAIDAIPGYKEILINQKVVASVADSDTFVSASGMKLKAEGGPISGPGGPKDDKIPAMLSNGEFVINAEQTSKWGWLLHMINAGRFADGGPVGSATGGVARFAAGGSVGGAGMSLPDLLDITAAWAGIGSTVRAVWERWVSPALKAMGLATDDTGLKFLALHDDAARPAFDGINATISKSADAVVTPAYEQINAGSVGVGAGWGQLNADAATHFGAVNAAVTNSVQGVVRPNYDQLNAGTVNVGQTMRNTYDGQIGPVWSQTGQTVSNTWTGTVAPTYGQMNAGSAGVGASFQGLSGTSNVSWSQIGSHVKTAYDGQIVPSWTGVRGFAESTGGFFLGISTGMNAARGTITDEVGKITVAVTDFFKMVDAQSVGSAAATTGNAILGMADGGPITAGTGPRADDVHIRVSKGEYVVNAEAARENRSELDRMNYGGAYADGGVVGEKIRPAVENVMVEGVHKAIEAGVAKALASAPSMGGAGGFSSNGVWGPENYSGNAANTQAAIDFVRQKWPTVAPIYGFGGGSVSTSDHPKGKAADFMIPAYSSPAGIALGTSLADWFIGNPNAFGTKYVIWRDRINQGGSWSAYSHPGGNNDTLAHRDHVHTSFLSSNGVFSGAATAPALGDDNPEAGGWVGAQLAKIAAGGTSAAGIAAPIAGAPEGWGSARNQNTNTQDQWNTQPTASMVGFVPPGDPVGRWAPYVAYALQMIGQDSTDARAAMSNQIRSESSGSPTAMNRSDVNFQRGYGSKGLIQLIGPTFDSFGYPGYNTNIVDPASNLMAGGLYSTDRYGSVVAGMRGVAYDNGGDWKNGTFGFNASGATERVLTGAERSGFLEMASVAGDFRRGGWQVPQIASAPVINVAPPVVHVYVGNEEITNRVRVVVDNRLADVGRAIDLARARSR